MATGSAALAGRRLRLPLHLTWRRSKDRLTKPLPRGRLFRPFSLVAVLNDLHKGRDTGKKWSAVIDFSAVLMTLVSLTGLTLIFFLHKRRFSGLVLVAVGALFCYLAYSFWIL